MKDLHTTTKVKSLLAPSIVDVTGEIVDIDLANFNAAELIIDLGANTGSAGDTSNKLDFKLEHADDNGAGMPGTYSAVAPADMLGATPVAGVFLSTDAAEKYGKIYQYGYIGGKRFLKVSYTETGIVSVTMAMQLIKGKPFDAPVN